MDRAKRFPKVVLLDATYNTNELKMPLICAFGVKNLGNETLKTFPTAFAWIVNEKEDMYPWFVKTLKEAINYSGETIFVTDKCVTLMNQLDKHFPLNKKLLCTWHMIQNMNTQSTLKIFSSYMILNEFKSNVFAMMNCTASKSYLRLKQKINAILSSPSNFVRSDM